MSVAILNRSHDRNGFDCGNEELNHFLRAHALQGTEKHHSVTRVKLAPDGATILGFYTVVPATVVTSDELPERARRGLPSKVPVVKLARLGVAKSAQGNGLGSELLLDALMQLNRVAKAAGAVGCMVDAKDGRAVSFYANRGFSQVDSDGDKTRMFLPLAFAKRWLQELGLDEGE